MHEGVFILPELLNFFLQKLKKGGIIATVQAISTIEGQQTSPAKLFNPDFFGGGLQKTLDRVENMFILVLGIVIGGEGKGALRGVGNIGP